MTRLRRRSGGPPSNAADAPPLVTVEAVRGVRRLAAVGADAEAAGLRAGQTLTDARAIRPDLVVADADPDADRDALETLAAWCARYTPLAAADPPDGLWLDVTGCAHLLGGEAALMQDLGARLERAAIPCRLALAGTAGAAWALARSPLGPARALLAPGQEAQALGNLPVAGLRLDARTVAGLRRLGLRTVAELARLPRADIVARFGTDPLRRLDQAMGRAPEAITWPLPPRPWSERLDFPEPIGTPEDLARALHLGLARLCARLAAADRGARRISACFLRVDRDACAIAVGTGLPTRDEKHLGRLLAERLETVDPGFGIEAVVLDAASLAPLGTPQPQFGTLARAADAERLTAVVDTLANRLGPGRVWRPAPRASHLPERETRRIPPLAQASAQSFAHSFALGPAWTTDPAAPRPIRLLRRPEPIEATAPIPDDPPILFRWRGVAHRVRAAEGPERIAAEWWHRMMPDADEQASARPETDLVRDYYRVEDTAGARFWLFRAGLHGAAAQAPRWYLHGLFA